MKTETWSWFINQKKNVWLNLQAFPNSFRGMKEEKLSFLIMLIPFRLLSESLFVDGKEIFLLFRASTKNLYATQQSAFIAFFSSLAFFLFFQLSSFIILYFFKSLRKRNWALTQKFNSLETFNLSLVFSQS